MSFHESRLRGKIDALKARIFVAEKLNSEPEKIARLKQLLATAQAELEALDA